MRILTYLCFAKGSLHPASIANFIEHADLGFEPTHLQTSHFGKTGSGVKLTSDTFDKLRGLSQSTTIRARSPEGSFVAGNLASGMGQLLILHTPDLPPDSLVERALALPGFAAALSGDADDVFWQSATLVNTYELKGRPWEHLPLVDQPTGPNRVWKKIDVSENVGRQAPGPTMWLWPASRMVFGAGAFDTLDRPRLLSFPDGAVTEGQHGSVWVNLFDLGGGETQIRTAQQRFRSWMDLDAVEALAQEKVAELRASHCIEVEEGTFDHGSVRRVTEFRDGHALVPQCRASHTRVFEFDASGAVISYGDS